jgi:hypothetical protein
MVLSVYPPRVYNPDNIYSFFLLHDYGKPLRTNGINKKSLEPLRVLGDKVSAGMPQQNVCAGAHRHSDIRTSRGRGGTRSRSAYS